MFISSVFALLTVAADPSAAAREPMGHAGFCAKVECTDAQRQTAHRIHESLKADLKDEREAIKSLRAELRNAMAAPDFDEAKVRSIFTRMDELQRKMSTERRDAMLDFVETLEPEQRRAFADRMEHRGKGGKSGLGKQGRGKGKAGAAKGGKPKPDKARGAKPKGAKLEGAELEGKDKHAKRERRGRKSDDRGPHGAPKTLAKR